ncbi:hypothetical protein PMG71_00120 [Roseofilum sp. BLCC_M154]|uniref:Carbon dioxide concentrating mechanism protein n=1 Tax=Roseofilum acuticapitatum BLCC-M154 TaxID=3022444 RepID=A0ABT7AML7_9CYAN|nr:hypothetical protein [Roseofilum acuticapitatum]MDJ1167827.1 hypothetical protein [Roseofilum acuticapitatum BLCC-M154]
MPWQPLHNQKSCVDGEVSIDPSAVVAPGVVLIANPQSRIAIAAGVCIGMGVVLHADGGTLRVEEGAILGAGVLVVGSGTIGARACVGPVSTVFNYSVEPEQVVAPGSLLGDRGRSEAEVAPKPVESVTEVEPVPEVKPEEEAAKSAVDPPKSNPSATQSSIHSAIARNLIANPPTSRINGHVETPSSDPSLDSSKDDLDSEAVNPPVYGHQHLQRLMSTLFPHRQAFDSGIQDSPVSEDNDR